MKKAAPCILYLDSDINNTTSAQSKANNRCKKSKISWNMYPTEMDNLTTMESTCTHKAGVIVMSRKSLSDKGNHDIIITVSSPVNSNDGHSGDMAKLTPSKIPTSAL